MSNLYISPKCQQFTGVQPPVQSGYAGDVMAVRGAISLPASMLQWDVIELVPLPAGSRIVDAIIDSDSLDSGAGSAAIKLSFGLEAAGVESYGLRNSVSGATSASSTATETLHFSGGPPVGVAVGMMAYDVTNPASIISGQTVTSVTGTTVVLSANVDAEVQSGDTIQFFVPPIASGTDILDLSTIAQAGGIARMTNVNGIRTAVAEVPVNVIAVVAVAPDVSAAGTLGLTLLYRNADDTGEPADN
jgi:hypothetical protein